jgi:hypothetical protein
MGRGLGNIFSSFFFIFILDLKNHFDFFLIFIYESCDQIRIKISYRYIDFLLIFNNFSFILFLIK